MSEPLGYEVEAARHPLDERFPEWGESPYFTVTVRRTAPLSESLTRLCVLVPVFEARKHYYVGPDETEKVLAKGGCPRTRRGTRPPAATWGIGRACTEWPSAASSRTRRRPTGTTSCLRTNRPNSGFQPP